ncbi:hypothetical protein VM1G_02240 [Cytospora mali]|uniref:Uncharacterized protein n=1 Tax=Cytospora mali TaxID=578113 RepID=A0A194VQ88_CYTMA|nr:hypothetical protein VM1G_02240 [Valsa mali]
MPFPTISSGVLPSQSQQGNRPLEEVDDRYELAVLTRMSDNEGWSDEEYTAALKRLAEKNNNKKTRPTPSTQTHTADVSATPSLDQSELVSTEKRQETVRITRQADSEGWSNEKILAALRLRNSIHYELREKIKPTTAELVKLQTHSATM